MDKFNVEKILCSGLDEDAIERATATGSDVYSLLKKVKEEGGILLSI